MAYNTFEGSKYQETKGLSRVEVAKLIRQDLKAALPGFKFRVTCRNSSIDLTIAGVPEGFGILANHSTDVYPWSARLTPEAAGVLDRVTDIHNAYNYDRSEIETDYFNVRYYGRPEFARELEQAERDAARVQVQS